MKFFFIESCNLSNNFSLIKSVVPVFVKYMSPFSYSELPLPYNFSLHGLLCQ